jgi:carbon storage regulator
MLVLSRQRDETIMIGDEIEITVVDIRGDKVRLGINAPTRIAVHRKEVYEAIRKENEQAAMMQSTTAKDLGVARAVAGATISAGKLRSSASKLSAGAASAPTGPPSDAESIRMPPPAQRLAGTGPAGTGSPPLGAQSRGA